MILSLAFIAFLITKHLSDVNLRMPPYYVVESIHGAGKGGKMHYDTVYHRLQPFDLVNQLGSHITRDDLEGKVTLVSFFHTSEQQVVPHLSATLQKIQDTYARSDSALRILSITTNPEKDTVQALKAYADKYRANHDMWWFLTGNTQKISDMAKTDFQVTLQPSGTDSLLFSPVLILLDKHEYVRGYYNVMDSARVKKCVRDIALLMVEKTRNEE